MSLLLLWTLVRLRKIGQHKSGPGFKKDTPDGDHVNGQNANGVLQVQEMFYIQMIDSYLMELKKLRGLLQLSEKI